MKEPNIEMFVVGNEAERLAFSLPHVALSYFKNTIVTKQVQGIPQQKVKINIEVKGSIIKYLDKNSIQQFIVFKITENFFGIVYCTF